MRLARLGRIVSVIQAAFKQPAEAFLFFPLDFAAADLIAELVELRFLLVLELDVRAGSPRMELPLAAA